MKIRSKLIMYLVSISLIAIFLSSFLFFINGKNALENRVGAQLESVAVLKENQLNYFIGQKIKDVDLLAGARRMNGILAAIEANYSHADATIAHKSAARELLKEELAKREDFLEFFILSTDGEIILSTDDSQEGKIRADRPYFIEAGKQTYVQSFYYRLAMQQPAITIAAPVKDNKDNAVGILAGRIDLKEINRIMKVRSGLGKTGETYLVSKFHFMIIEPRIEMGFALKNIIHTYGLKDCLKGNSGSASYHNYRNIPVFGVYKWIPEREVCLLAEIAQKEAFMPISRLRNIMILFSIGIIGIIFGLSILVSRMISEPILDLKNSADEIAKGNLKTRIQVKSNDEISSLAESFETMRKRLKERMEDIEEANKQLKILDKAKDEFLSVVSHELKTPITPMRTYVDMLLSMDFGKLNKKQVQPILVIKRNVHRLTMMINDLLDAIRLQTNRLEMGFVGMDMQKLVRKVVSERKETAEKQGLKILAARGDIPIIEGDPDRLEQVLTNLLDNAFKFTKPGGAVKVSVNKGNDSIIVSVEDTGIGISKENLSRIFDKFYQVDSSKRRKYGGTGLGLAICKGIIEMHHGRIWIKSNVNKGTAVSFSLPIKQKK